MFTIIYTISLFLLVVGLTGISVLVFYLWLFAVTYLFAKIPKNRTDVVPQSRFVFVVPAHNEEDGITATVQNILRVYYPRDLFDIVVIADNCSDKTALQAKNAGAECIERFNTDLRGKGYALSLAFSELIPRNYDAYIVIDADSLISENFLSILDARLQRGEQVVQSYYGMSNPDASILTYLFQVGSLIENKLFWEPKQIFGLPIILRGNGMCFAHAILEKFPWNAFSIVEDTEYGLTLTENSIRIHFAPDIGVYACQPETLQQAFAQRVRWAAGNSTLTKSRAIKMIILGVFRGNIASIDLGLSLIAGSRPLLLVANGALIVLSIILNSHLFVIWSCSLLAAQVLYIGLGIVLNGFSLQKMLRLFLSPFYLTWLSVVSLLGAVGFRKNQWVRTTRS